MTTTGVFGTGAAGSAAGSKKLRNIIIAGACVLGVGAAAVISGPVTGETNVPFDIGSRTEQTDTQVNGVNGTSAAGQVAFNGGSVRIQNHELNNMILAVTGPMEDQAIRSTPSNWGRVSAIHDAEQMAYTFFTARSHLLTFVSSPQDNIEEVIERITTARDDAEARGDVDEAQRNAENLAALMEQLDYNLQNSSIIQAFIDGVLETGQEAMNMSDERLLVNAAVTRINNDIFRDEEIVNMAERSRRLNLVRVAGDTIYSLLREHEHSSEEVNADLIEQLIRQEFRYQLANGTNLVVEDEDEVSTADTTTTTTTGGNRTNGTTDDTSAAARAAADRAAADRAAAEAAAADAARRLAEATTEAERIAAERAAAEAARLAEEARLEEIRQNQAAIDAHNLALQQWLASLGNDEDLYTGEFQHGGDLYTHTNEVQTAGDLYTFSTVQQANEYQMAGDLYTGSHHLQTGGTLQTGEDGYSYTFTPPVYTPADEMPREGGLDS